MRNLAVTGTPYGVAAATAARDDRPQQARPGRHGGAAALARDLGRRAPEVEVDVVDEPAAAHPVDGAAHHHGVGAVHLQAARVLVGIERDQVIGLGVAVHERRGHDHLVDVHQPRPEPPAQRPERRVRHARHRRQHHRRLRHEVTEPKIHAIDATGPVDSRPCVASSPSGPRPVGRAATASTAQPQVGVGADVEGGGAVEAEAVPAGGGDHRRVVGAHGPAGQEAAQAVGRAGVEEVLAQLGVGGDAAAEGQALGADLGRGPAGLVHEHVDDGGLERRRHVGRLGLGVGPHVVHHRRLQPGEAEVEPLVAHRPGEVDRRRVAVLGHPLDGRAAGVAEPEEPGDLVERLAGGVVDRLAEQPVAARARASRRASCGRPTRAARRSASRSTGRRAAPRRGGPRGG